MVLSVRRRIHCGMGLFCFCFLPRMRLILKDLWDGCKNARMAIRGQRVKAVMTADTASRADRSASDSLQRHMKLLMRWHAEAHRISVRRTRQATHETLN